jgi:hypothetical protein
LRGNVERVGDDAREEYAGAAAKEPREQRDQSAEHR